MIDPARMKAPDGKRTRSNGGLRLLRRIASVAAVTYVAWCTILYLMQDSLIFPRSHAGPVMPEDSIPPDIERGWLDIGSGGRVEYWFAPARASPDAQALDARHRTGRRPLLVYFHGNGDLIDHILGAVEPYRTRGVHALMIEYRGYGRSGGRPSEGAIVADSLAIINRVLQRADVDASRIIIHGRSLGSGVGAQVAIRMSSRPAAIVLESPFTSVMTFAARYGVPPILVRSPFRTDLALGTLTAPPPTLILHSRDDEIVPFAHGIRLKALIKGSRFHEMTGSHMAALEEAPGIWNGGVLDTFLRDAGLVAE